MKKRLRLFIVLTLLIPMMFAACGKTPAALPQNSAGTPSASPSGSPAQETSPPEASPAPTDFHSGVKTDFSVLTPYEPMAEIYTRLTDGPMPVLKPSGDYGTLLPYVGMSLYGNGGYMAFRMYGLCTADGMVVTDPVYASAYQGSYYDYMKSTSLYVPAYDLMKVSDKIDKDNMWDSRRHAVCALDGSWVTKFDYMNVYFTDKVILAMRSIETNDIDVLDYSGKLLFNTTSLGCYDLVQANSGYSFMGGYGEGMIAVPLTDGQTVYIDAQTGAERYTVYKQGEAFYGGYARVRETENGPIGFIDKDFQLVLKPQFLYADSFVDGRTVVQSMDGSYAVIDTGGAVLFESKDPISRWNKDIYSVNSNSTTSFYDGSFHKIESDGGQIMPLGDGWFYYPKGDGVVIQKGSEKYTLDGIKDIGSLVGGLVCYYVSGSDGWSEGVKTLDGKDVVPLTKNTSVYVVTSKKTGDAFIVMSTYNERAMSQSFKILSTDGETILSGGGYATYCEPFNLFVVNNELSFGYTDTRGEYIFKISLLQYLPD